MRFFTAELYMQGQNFDDVDVADRVDKQWHENSQAYEKYLKEINLPENVIKYLNNARLHDGRMKIWNPPFPHAENWEMVVEGENNHQLCILRYTLSHENYSILSFEKHEFGLETEFYYLYDEFLAEDGIFIHNILFSNGYEFSVRFTHFEMLLINNPNFV